MGPRGHGRRVADAGRHQGPVPRGQLPGQQPRGVQRHGPGERTVVDQPDMLIVEGLNVLQPGPPPEDGQAIPFVSDFFDFSIYVDADEVLLRTWYVDRFLALRETTFRDPRSHFHSYAKLSDSEATETGTSIWARINLVNLRENILPTRQRADLILKKGDSHRVDEVALRKL